ncbi:spermidine/putrescine-binding protein [Bradyrhizobium sp. GM24.11]
MFDLDDLAVPPATDWTVFSFFAGGIAWDPKKYGSGKHPATFAEFFDLVKFPGRRALPNYPNVVLEMALLADGVAPKDIYPLELDRAFKALARIKASVATWYPATPQSISLVQTGEVDFSYTLNVRVKPTNERGGGTPLAFSFEQNLIIADGMAVLKGAPNKENAIRLIAYLMRPEVQARVAEHAGLTPVSKKALPMLSAEVRKWQPDLSNASNLTQDAPYWAENFDAVSRRFKQWILS